MQCTGFRIECCCVRQIGLVPHTKPEQPGKAVKGQEDPLLRQAAGYGKGNGLRADPRSYVRLSPVCR